jgi:DNA relaxase NicK
MLPRNPVESVTEVYDRARTLIRSLSDEHERIFFSGTGFDRAARISNFDLCLARDNNSAAIGGRGPQGHMLFQLSGRGCDAIRDNAVSRRFVGEIAELLTRFDYAVDVSTRTRPVDFANSRSHRAFRTISYIKSDSGSTVYVGSPKSDRFCRVYRYNPPHPRSHLLRIEFVFRRAMARTAAGVYCEQENDTEFLARLGNTYGYAHQDWQPEARSDHRISTPSVDRHTEDTVAWLYKQVAPAMARVMATGGFDMADFLQHVYKQEKKA